MLQQVYTLLWFVAEVFHCSLVISGMKIKEVQQLKNSRKPHQLEFHLKIVWVVFFRQMSVSSTISLLERQAVVILLGSEKSGNSRDLKLIP